MNASQNGGVRGVNGRLHSLLTQSTADWNEVLEYILNHPQEAKERYYRSESPLQSALKAKECRDANFVGDQTHTERMKVLQALVDADPASISHRDEEGRTCLHTACAAGRSAAVLQWLIEAEERLSLAKLEIPECNVTLRTDFPGGTLPLHSVATSSMFDFTSSDSELMHQEDHPLSIYPIQCNVTPNIVSAYNSTTPIRRAYPEAVWGRDCEGETPLHSAASWGSVGSVLSLLVGIAVITNAEGRDVKAELARAALIEDDREKSPLDRACERVCAMCVHRRRRSTSPTSHEQSNASFRRSIAREDPFQATTSADDGSGRRSLLRSSRAGSARRRIRIPGCGSSFRSSLTSSLVGSSLALDMDEDDPTETSQQAQLWSSFVSPRRAINPILGLEPLDSDGNEQLAKVEMLARAASLTSTTTILVPTLSEAMAAKTLTASPFHCLHSTIALGCPPEVAFHVAVKNPDQVLERNQTGHTPLLVACERLATLHSRRIAKVTPTNESAEKDRQTATEEATEGATEEAEEKIGNQDEEAAGRFVQSLLLGGSCDLLDSSNRSAQPKQAEEQEQQSSPPSAPNNAGLFCDDEDPTRNISLTQETIRLLLHSSKFGRPEKAATPNSEGRLPLHLVLQAGLQWRDVDANCVDKSVVKMLVDASPRSLDAKDPKSGLLPFMIAAAASNELEIEDTLHLETIHQLLLAAPNVVSFHD